MRTLHALARMVHLQPWRAIAFFGALSAVALWQRGIFEPHFQTVADARVFADLVLALSIIMVWMWRDARGTGRNPWPWSVATLTLAFFRPLVHLLIRRPTIDGR